MITYKVTKESLRGSITIEAAVIVPLILTVFALLVTVLFYYHDKNVVACVAHETVVMGAGKEDISEIELEQYVRARLRGRLLFFSDVSPKAEVEEEEIVLTCQTRKKGMSLQVKMSMNRTEPEKQVRNLRRLERIGEQVGEIE